MNRHPPVTTTLFVLGSAASLNFLVCPLLTAIPPRHMQSAVIAVAGILGAEIGLTAAWGVFSAARFFVRSLGCVAVGITLYAAFACGAALAATYSLGHVPREPLLLAVAAAPLVFVSVSAPMWAARIWLRWQMLPDGHGPRGSYTEPLQIKHVVFASTAVGVALAIARLAPWLASAGSQQHQAVLVGLLLLAAFACIASLGTMPLVLFFVLGIKRGWLAATWLAGWFCMVVATLTGLVLFASRMGNGPVSLEGSVYITSLATGSFALISCSALIAARMAGYRLHFSVPPLRPSRQPSRPARDC